MHQDAGATAAGPGGVSDGELAEIARALPLFMHALKGLGGPPDPVLREHLAAGTLGPRHLGALHVVAAEGPMSVSALASRLGVALPTASLMVGELSRSGLLHRAEDPEDRRRTIVRVAPGVEAPVRDLVERRLTPLRRAMERLTADQRRGFLLGLRAMGEEVAAAVSDPPPCPWDAGAGPPEASPPAP